MEQNNACIRSLAIREGAQDCCKRVKKWQSQQLAGASIGEEKYVLMTESAADLKHLKEVDSGGCCGPSIPGPKNATEPNSEQANFYRMQHQG